MIFDNKDKNILNILQSNGRITNTQLAEKVGLSPPAMLERVKKLESLGYISRYAAIVNNKKMGIDIVAFISISISLHQTLSLDKVKSKIGSLEEVLECHQISGQKDFLLKVAHKNINSYTDFINNKLSEIEGIQKIKSFFVLDTVKSETAINF